MLMPYQRPKLPVKLSRLRSPCQLFQFRASSGSSRWKSRQGRDMYAREARVQGLKSRAAFKLLEMDVKYKLFKPGQTVVDLGYAPGSWSQVAVERTKPSGKIIGIDLIPAQPPRGVTTVQGNFLSRDVRDMVKRFIVQLHGREPPPHEATEGDAASGKSNYMDTEAALLEEKLVDIVLSDMSEPWEQTSGFGKNTLSNPYHRMMNTSGVSFKDHSGSMDLCSAALTFAKDTLKTGGHFVCKFYQGAEDKALEQQLKKLFSKVHRGKPESSRSESKEAYFVALRRKPDTSTDNVAHEQSVKQSQ